MMMEDDKEILDKLYEYRDRIKPDPALLSRILAVIRTKPKKVSAYNLNFFQRLRFSYLMPLGAAAIITIALLFNFSSYLKQPTGPDFLTTAFAEETKNEKAAHAKESKLNAEQLNSSVSLNTSFDSNQLGL